MSNKLGAVTCGFLALAPFCFAQAVGPYAAPIEARPEARLLSEPPLRLAESAPIERPVALPPATEGARDQLDALRDWNRSNRTPTRIGIVRALPEEILLRPNGKVSTSVTASSDHGLLVASSHGSVIWGTRISVAEAFRLRVHLSDVGLPPSARFWIWGKGEPPLAFGMELRGPNSDIWTPSVAGDTAYLEAEIPLADYRHSPKPLFRISEIAERIEGTKATCVLDATCITSADFSAVDSLRNAVAFVDFVDAQGEHGCTGTLLNDMAGDGKPYFLTAHHCISTPSAAASVTAFWNWATSACGASPTNASLFPQSSGATLLATGSGSDFTLLLLTGPLPSGRWFMGWDSRPSSITPGTMLFRISHPDACPAPDHPCPQAYSTSVVSDLLPTCIGLPASAFIYSARSQGGIEEGSSGSAVVLASGQVVGQLYGTCPGGDGCDNSIGQVDGGFAATYPTIAPFLAPVTSQACTVDANTLCLSGGRFRLTANYRSSLGAGAARAVSLSDSSGFFPFDNPDSVELVVKVLNACSFDPHIWIFAGGLTNQETTLTATDTRMSVSKTYFNPLGTTFVTVTDTAAFSTCP